MADEINSVVEVTSPTPPGPGSGSAPVGRPKTKRARLRARKNEEYVSGTLSRYTGQFAESLPEYIDDITAEMGADTYERMYTDAHVAGETNALMLTAVSGGWTLKNPVELKPGEEESEEYRKAEEIRRFCSWSLSQVDVSAFLLDMARGCYLGHRLAEIVYKVGTWEKEKRLTLSRLKVKERCAYSLVVDNRKNILGVVGNIAGSWGTLLSQQVLISLENAPNLLPREKFAIFSHRMVASDPRGTSVLRSAYNFWWLKLQALAEYAKYLRRYASPIPVGKTSPNPQDEEDDEGETISAEDKMGLALQSLDNDSYVVIPNGAEIEEVFKIASTGEAFTRAFTYYDKQISKAILSQTLGTNEGEHQARAASSSAKDVMDLVGENLETGLSAMVKNDILFRLVDYNFGIEAAEQYTPDFSLSQAEEADMKPLAEAFAALKNAGLLQDSQLPYVYARLGLPAASVEKQAEETDPKDAEKEKPEPGSDTEDIADPDADDDAEETDEDDEAEEFSRRDMSLMRRLLTWNWRPFRRPSMVRPGKKTRR